MKNWSRIEAILLFGSYVKGKEKPGDIDYFVVSDMSSFHFRNWQPGNLMIPFEYNGRIPTNLDLSLMVNAFDEKTKEFEKTAANLFRMFIAGDEKLTIITLSKNKEKYQRFISQFKNAKLLLIATDK